MSAQLPRPSASAGAASGRAVIRGKMAMLPAFEPPATIPEIPPTVERAASPVFELPATIPELPPPVERVTGGEQHVVMGGGER